MSTLLHLLVLLHVVVLTNANDHDASTSEVCTTPQYLRMGDTGVIECDFGNFYSVYWYNSTDSEQENPLVAMKDSLKTGEGYDSGQFDVFPNGSFIIRRVSLLHDHSFRVIVLKSKDGDDYVIRDIRVYVVVATNQPYPFIKTCGQKAFCFARLGGNYQLYCSVNETRPAADVIWVQRYTLGDRNVSTEYVTVQHNTVYSATSKTVTTFAESQTAILFICKVSGPPHVISKSESMVFVENIDKDYPSAPKLTKNAEVGMKLTLACPTNNTSFVIWKKRSKTEEWTSIITVVFEDDVYSKVYVDSYSLDGDGSLIMSQVGIDDEGSYMCIYSTSEAEKAQVMEVVLFDLPDPPYLIVEGCTPGERCVLEVQREGNLTCSVKAIRPNVRLDWLPFPEEYIKYISFFDRQEVIKENKNTYDISVTSRYTLKDGDQTKLAVECRVSNWDNTMLELDKKLELHFVSDVKKNGSNAGPIWIIILFILLLVVAIVVGIIIIQKRKRGSKKSSTEGKEGKNSQAVDETAALSQNQDTTNIDEEEENQTSDEKDNPSTSVHYESDADVTQHDNGEEKFKQNETNDITNESSSTTGDVREHTEKKSVSSDSKNVSLSAENSEQREIQGATSQVESYTDDGKNASENGANEEEDNENHFQNQLQLKYEQLYTVVPVPGLSKEKKCVNDFFVQRDFEFTSSEGDSSTKEEFQSHHDLLSRPFDYPPRLHLKGTGKLTLILQLAYEWCKARNKYENNFETFIFLNLRDFKGELSLYKTIKDVLVPDSRLNEQDIEERMETYQSGLLVLYGLGKSSFNLDYDIGKVISSDILQNFHVIFTTPDDDVNFNRGNDFETHTVTIKELNKRFFEEYITKNAFKDKGAIKKIIANFDQAPYLHKLCKFPVVFAMYASVYSKKDLILETAKGIFENALLPSEKSGKRSRKDQDQLLKEEGNLAKLAFDCLISNNKETSWLIEELISNLGKDVVSRYEETGLLIRCNTKSDDSSLYPVKDRCKFSHKIIFDWYVACHFRQLKKHEVKVSVAGIAPYASENVFCFICGIKQDYAETVIETLQHHKRINTQLLMFCLLEQEEAGEITGTDKTVQKHFKPRIRFTNQDTSLYQQSLNRLLISKIASDFKDNGINTLAINKCLKIDSHSKDHLSLVSDVQIPPFDFVEYLEIESLPQKLEDIQPILEYAASCKSLKKIMFDHCLLPFDFKGLQVPDKYMKGAIEVEWPAGTSPQILDFSILTWKEKWGEKQLDEEVYHAVEDSFRQRNDHEN